YSRQSLGFGHNSPCGFDGAVEEPDRSTLPVIGKKFRTALNKVPNASLAIVNATWLSLCELTLLAAGCTLVYTLHCTTPLHSTPSKGGPVPACALCLPSFSTE